MWRVQNSDVTLPQGFHLEEDEDFVYLIRDRDEKNLAVFSVHSVDPYQSIHLLRSWTRAQETLSERFLIMPSVASVRMQQKA